MALGQITHTPQAQTAFILHPELKQPQNQNSGRSASDKLEEAVGLAHAISLDVIHTEILSVNRPRAATVLGPGVIERIAQMAEDNHHPLIIINLSLSPVQHRNLETELKCKVIDRTALILEIFGARAQTHAGRLQVELAALSFQKSRLVRSWTHLERQRGGGGFLGGPGERQIELDRRMLTDQVKQIKSELSDVTRTRHLQRQHRSRNHTPTIVLVGYTNAGKSTLFNLLTGAGVLSQDMLFATLDPTMRQLTLPSSRQLVLADTVGFISDLPTELIEAFKSTLDEVILADLILHVQDASSELLEEEEADVLSVLSSLGLSEEDAKEKIIPVFNKIDAVDSERQDELKASSVSAVSAVTGDGIDVLLERIDLFFAQAELEVALLLTPAQAQIAAWLHQHGQVLLSEFDEMGRHHLQVRLDEAHHNKLFKSWPELTPTEPDTLSS